MGSASGVSTEGGVVGSDLISLLAILAISDPAPPLRQESLVVRYDGPSRSTERCGGIAADGQGNVYVTGSSSRSPWSGFGDFVTVKYDASGRQLWLARSQGEDQSQPTAIAVDGSGNSYVIGRRSRGTAIIKYDPEGNEVWKGAYSGDPRAESDPYHLAVDAAGNVYVAGILAPDGAGSVYVAGTALTPGIVVTV